MLFSSMAIEPTNFMVLQDDGKVPVILLKVRSLQRRMHAAGSFSQATGTVTMQSTVTCHLMRCIRPCFISACKAEDSLVLHKARA